MTTVYADFHRHTKKSDGTDDPIEALFSIWQHAEVATISDHDTTAGWEELLVSPIVHVRPGHGLFVVDPDCFISPAGRDAYLGDRSTKVYHGIELTVLYHDRGIHLLGLGIDPPPKPVREKLREQTAYRYARLREMTDEINGRSDGIYADVRVPWDESDGTHSVRSIAGASLSPTKLHVGAALHLAGYGVHARDSMEKYVANLKAAKKFDYSLLYPMHEGIAVIQGQLRGVAGLAHPFRTAERTLQIPVEELIADFASQGGQFLDANTPEEVERLTALGSAHNLFVTGGSDTHGYFDKGWRPNQMPYVAIPSENIVLLEDCMKKARGSDTLDLVSPDPHM